MHKNSSIKCDVKNCAHHAHDNYCTLDCISVTCGCESCTCCGSYSAKD